MTNVTLDIKQLDKIVKKTIDAVNDSKVEIYEIAETARREHRRLEADYQSLKRKAIDIQDEVTELEKQVIETRNKLAFASKNFKNFTQDELKKAYEDADLSRVQLALKRQEEQHVIQRRNDIEISLKESVKTIEKADNLIGNLGVSMGYLTGDLLKISDQLEEAQQSQQIGIRIIKAQEEERKRVAREIHDGPAQSMSNVVLKAEICERLLSKDIDKTKAEMSNLKQVVRDSLQDVRRIIYDLRPMSLDDLGLVPTLQKYASNFEEENNIKCEFKTMGSVDDVSSIIALTIFRITQEALANSKKHGKANNISIIVEFSQSRINFSISDDGVGFDLEEVGQRHFNVNSGFGLYSMKERLDLLNGKFEITSIKNEGTKLNMVIPLIEDGSLNE
jgi:two-component system sensor histidine kinase DegS